MMAWRHLSIVLLLAAVRSAQLLRPGAIEIRAETRYARKWDYSDVSVIRLRGGSASIAVQPQAAVALRPTARTVERDASEGLEAHKAALRRAAAASRPTLVVGALSNAGPSGAVRERPPTLSLVRPAFDDGGEERVRGTAPEAAEAAKRFEAFAGTGHAILTPEQVKKSSASEMHKLAIARLARLQRQSAAPSGNVSVEEAAAAEAAAEAEAEAAFRVTHGSRPPAAGATAAAVWESGPAFADQSEAEGEREGGDEGGAWREHWGVNATTGLRYGGKAGRDHAGEWREAWTEVAPGQFKLDGSNGQGHLWGEEWGVHPNGTAWRSKFLNKVHEGYEERSGANSAGQTSGLRRGRAQDGTWWQEEWVQNKEATECVAGRLMGSNEHGETWEEVWETEPLNAFDAETGKQKTSAFGQKSGVDREGKQWSEAWGDDEVYGKWGTRSEVAKDGSEWTENWGSNMEGDIWCAKWGIAKRDLGVSEEWGFKCGQKNLRIGQEMDGRVNTEAGKVETWTESWCKTFEADGRLARTHAEKEGNNGFGDRWVEKWDELYARDGYTEKWASKTGQKDATRDEWKEEWGEKRAPPDEHNPSGRFLSCWAEKRGSNGYGERWHDQWSEGYEHHGMGGHKVCNKWRLNGDGSERVERSGEEWDGRGWFQKGGETLMNGGKVDGWHERAW